MKYLIQNGTVYDGTGAPAYAADVLIEDDRIAAVAPNLTAAVAVVIDATGMAVTPGFIDMHRHCDITPVADKNFGRVELAQGITTTIAGNCGLAPVPSVDLYRNDVNDFIEPCLGKVPSGFKLAHYRDFTAALEDAHPKINMGFFAATGAIKAAVKGFSKTPYTPEEMRAAAAYMKEAMEEGAFGVSMGIMYQPECYSTKEEFVSLIQPAAKSGGILCCHIRGEGDSLVPSVEEIIEIAARAQIRLNISHFKSTGIKNWGEKIYQAIDCIEKARNCGQEITVDFYPYTGGSTTLQTLLPPCVLEEDNASTLNKLATEAGKKELREQIYRTHPGWDNMVTAIGWERIIISSLSQPKNLAFQGKNLAELAAENGYSEPSDLVCDLLVEEDGKVGIIVLSMDQNDVDAVARLPYSAVISDSLYGGGGNPHPRLFGSFPKVIREYVMERSVLTMEQAIQKMTGMPANRLRLGNRGELTPGNFADINVFDPKKLADHAVYTAPNQLSTGMEWVFVNGVPAWHNEEILPQNNACVLKRIN